MTVGNNVWQTVVGAASPQTLGLTLPHLGTASGVSRIELALSGVSRLEGWCVNGRFASGSQTGDDFSFAPAYDLRAITVLSAVQYSHANERQLLASSAYLKLFCKDTGGRCVLTATPYDGDGNAMAPVTVAIPADENGNGIADVWERDKVTQHNGIYPSAPLAWPPASYADPQGDGEPAALGVRRTDGTYSHADTGDGLSILDEYRGYLLDGGAGFTGTRHVRLSPALKELLVQVAEQDAYLSDMGNGDVTNPSAMQAYSLASSMQAVAQFYAHPQRGAGIDLYWVRTPFSMPVVPHTYTNGEYVANLYRHTGTIEYVPTATSPSNLTVNGGSVWIWRDEKLLREDGVRFDQVFSLEDDDAQPRETGKFIQLNRNDDDLKHFVKMILPSRTGIRLRNTATGNSYCRMEATGHAQALFNASPIIFQGVHVDVMNISEEGYVNTGGHYLPSGFMDVIRYSIGHEFFRVIGGRHQKDPPGTGSLIQPFLSH